MKHFRICPAFTLMLQAASSSLVLISCQGLVMQIRSVHEGLSDCASAMQVLYVRFTKCSFKSMQWNIDMLNITLKYRLLGLCAQ